MSDRTQKLTRRQRRLEEKKLLKTPSMQSLNMTLTEIGPITDNQIKAFQAYQQGKHVFLLGTTGTGKTFVSLYLALKEITERKSRRSKLTIIRSAQPSKQIGFLPGTDKQKMEVYETPYRTVVNDLFGRGDAYEILKLKGVIDFQPTSFLRGTTLEDSIILIDEFQNMSFMELFTVLTRTGDKSKVIVCGDIEQDDLTNERYKELSGGHDFINLLEEMNEVEVIYFNIDDIVRSGFVRSLIIAKHKLGL